MKHLLIVDDREFATVLAGLRHWQYFMGSTDCLRDFEVELVREVAQNQGRCTALSVKEIDALCQRLNSGEPARIAVCLEGGIVQDVFTDNPALVGLTVVTIDYDSEGADEQEISHVKQPDGSLEPAVCGYWEAEQSRIDLAEVCAEIGCV